MKEDRNILMTGTKLMCVALLLIGMVSCNKRTEKKLVDGAWLSVERTIEYDSGNVVESGDSFNQILNFTTDGRFYRASETGVWSIEAGKLVVVSYGGSCTRRYTIINCSNKELILESRRSPTLPIFGCADGDENDPRVTEVYERSE
ncbi:MAG: hypothetical protein GQ574_18890 [Crocinitomix sp.]|nr:hypothetical protein [Crocinitomix sp.]